MNGPSMMFVMMGCLSDEFSEAAIGRVDDADGFEDDEGIVGLGGEALCLIDSGVEGGKALFWLGFAACM